LGLFSKKRMFSRQTMKRFRKITGILLLSLIGIGFSFSQQVKDTLFVFNPIVDDITQRIPPLDDLIDSAIVHAPLLKSIDADIYINKYLVKTQRREWMSNLYLDAGIDFDFYDGLTNNTTNLGDQNSVLTTQDNTRYAIGASIRMPMDDLWDRRNRVKTATKLVERSMSERDYQILELRKAVIEQYNQLIINQRILKIANDNQIFMALQMAMAEKDFINGQMTLYEMARLNEMNRKAVTDFETARVQFYDAYMILQEIVGIKFNVINKIE
jgi:outer membrane protein TolC